jgi:carbonic anhydrase
VLLGRRGLLNLATCACCAQLDAAARANEWTYGSSVAAGWPAVSKTCGVGGAQSPVDLAAAAVAAQDTCVLALSRLRLCVFAECVSQS